MNELIKKMSWWSKNRKWFWPFLVGLIAIGFLFSNSTLAEGISDITKAYADAALYENAFKKAQENEEVKLIIGKIEPIDKMAIAEGFVKYSENNNSVKTTVRLIGTKGKGKIDILANRIENNWEYQKISVRTKEPKQTIIVLE